MRELFTSVRRTPYQSLASFLIIFFTLFMSLFFFNMISFFHSFLSYVETTPQVIVYFQPQTSEKDILRIKDSIQSSGKASTIKYVSKQEALKIYRNFSKKDPLLSEMVSADILPPSLEVIAKKPTFLVEIAEYVKKQPGINEVFFPKDILDKLLNLTDILRKVSLFVFVFLIVTSALVLITTSAFKITLKKEEIELMRLLGASTFYIRRPFILEGVFFGVASGLTAFIFFYAIMLYMSPFLSDFLSGIPSLSFMGLSNLNLFIWPPSINFILLSLGLTMASGILIGLIGNYLATSKYIK